MNRNQEKSKKLKDQKYWDKHLQDKKDYEDREEQWKKDLIKINPEIPKPYKKP